MRKKFVILLAALQYIDAAVNGSTPPLPIGIFDKSNITDSPMNLSNGSLSNPVHPQISAFEHLHEYLYVNLLLYG